MPDGENRAPAPPEALGPEEPFDFSAHGRRATEEYQRLRSHYENLAQVARDIMVQCLAAENIRVHSIEARAKSVDSFERKAVTPLDADPAKPKYPNPLDEITDLAGIRVITFFPRTVATVDAVLSREFDIVEKSDKSAELLREGRFGYYSVHYLVRLSERRRSLPEYSRFSPRVFEIQVRTILQHAWAEIEHDIQYKSVVTIPDSIRRRFMSLAGMLEIADREFQAIQDDDEHLRRAARASVREGRLQDVETTPDALKTYLDARLGPDGRMSDFSYQFTAEVLRNMGFSTLGKVDEAIGAYNDDLVSRAIRKSRYGQLTRFEDTLLAAMGETFILRHSWGIEPWFISWSLQGLQSLKTAGIPIGNYRPTPDVANGKQFLLRTAIDVIDRRSSVDRGSLERVLATLEQQERSVLEILYGFTGDHWNGLEHVAVILQLETWQAYQIRARALSRLEAIGAPAR
jgi:putative GTP pyrophosphokinase